MVQQSELSKVQLRAALAVAKDEDSDEAIAAQCRVSRLTLHRWKIQPRFQERVEEHRRLWREEIKAEGIANRQNRVTAYNDRWLKMQRVIDARAATPTPLETNSDGYVDDDEEPERIPVPGWETGLLVKVVRVTGKAVEMRYEVDTALLGEMRATEKQAAQDLKQWVEKSESLSENVTLGLIGIRIEDI